METRIQNYFYIRNQGNGFLSSPDSKHKVGVMAPQSVSCRWRLSSHVTLFHWTGHYLVNGNGNYLGVDTSVECGPGFKKVTGEITDAVVT